MSKAPALPIGSDISKMLRSQGPVVKCVLLRCIPKDDTAPAVDATKSGDDDDDKRPVLVHLLEELDIDTTPKKQMVNQVLGGAFTFVGQYEDEGIVLMARKEDDELPVNPHSLQPPLDEAELRGDILIMKVAATEEELDNEEEAKDVVVPTNDEFFLSYTKDEYVAFASRTDVVAPEPPEEEEEESGAEEEEEDEDEEEYDVLEDDDDDEEPSDEERTGLMNLLMRSILRTFTEDNGRGPNTVELLEIRRALATKMGIAMADIPSFDEEPVAKKKKVESPSRKSPYRSILTRRQEEEEDDDQPARKKVKFGKEHFVATFAVTEEEKKGE